MTFVEFSFAALNLTTDDPLVKPRSWTAAQSAWGEFLLGAPPGRVLELCAGAGHIGLAAVYDTDRRLVTVDRERTTAARIHADAEMLGVTERVEMRGCPSMNHFAASV